MHPAFVENRESQAWFDTIAGVPDELADQVQIPDPETWKSSLAYVEVPDQDLEAVLATTPSMESDTELFRILQRGASHLVSYMGKLEYPTKFAALNDVNDPNYRYFYVQMLTACVPFVRQYHESLGIPDAITQASLADLGRNVRVHRKREGVGGLGVMWWLMLHFRGVIFQIGRLQFEMQNADNEIAESIVASGGRATEETNVLSIHIPDFMGPMDHDACSESISQAVDFFTNYFPEWPVEYAVCNSWLLDPNLKQYLKPTSNIVRFQERFKIVEATGDSNDSVMQFVFGKHVKDIDTITPRSSLERGVIEYIRDGRAWKFTPGWFALPKCSNP